MSHHHHHHHHGLFLSGRAAVRRRQPEEPPGEGEAGSFPHAALHPSGLPEPPAGDDRGGRRQASDGTLPTEEPRVRKRANIVK